MSEPVMAVTRSAAATFASIEELLLILTQYIEEPETLWSLCLANWRFNCVFTAKLAEHVVVRVEKQDDDEAVKHLVDCLIAGPYLSVVPHLQITVDKGPTFSEKTLGMLAKLLNHTPNLKVFTWDATSGSVPVSMLAHLGARCNHLAELHLKSGPETQPPNNNNTNTTNNNPTRGSSVPLPSIPSFASALRVLTCRGLDIWQALHILSSCGVNGATSGGGVLEKVRFTRLERVPTLGWFHSGYHAHLRRLIRHEEAVRGAQGGGRALRIDMCYSRGPRGDSECEVCERGDEGMRDDGRDERVSEVWPWAEGRARQFLVEGEVRHIMYEYPGSAG